MPMRRSRRRTAANQPPLTQRTRAPMYALIQGRWRRIPGALCVKIEEYTSAPAVTLHLTVRLQDVRILPSPNGPDVNRSIDDDTVFFVHMGNGALTGTYVTIGLHGPQLDCTNIVLDGLSETAVFTVIYQPTHKADYPFRFDVT